MVEMKLMIALAVREWDFEAAPVEKTKHERLLGSKYWQVTPPEEITMHPRNGMPMRVRKRVVKG